MNSGALAIDKLLRVLVILAASFFGQKLIRLVLRRFQKTVKKLPDESLPAHRRRIKTLISLMRTTSFLVVNLTALFLILSELGFDIIPLLTGVGFLGLAFGFGAKALVADLIAGFFILFENQFNVGDEIQAAPGARGKVAKITLRTITLKDNDGNLYIVPNSAIKTIIKFPKPKKK